MKEIKIDKEAFSKRIDELANSWDISGGYSVYYKGEKLQKNIYGYEDRENNVPVTEQSTYSFSTYSTTLLAILIMKFVEDKKIKLSDKLNKFIPEYKQADKITIKNILMNSSGIPDFFYSKIMVELEKDEEHRQLSENDRIGVEKKLFYENQSLEAVLGLIGEDELEFVPGNTQNHSESDSVFLGTVIERVAGMPLFDVENKLIFEPLGIKVSKSLPTTVSYEVFRDTKLVRLPQEINYPNYFTTTFDEIEKLMFAFVTGKILSKETWDVMLKFDKEGMGIGFQNSNGMAFGRLNYMATEFGIYFNQKTELCFGHIVNQEIIFKNIDGSNRYFKRDAREEIETLFTYPVNTKMIPINKQNLWHALEIKIDPSQLEFVLEAKSSIAMCLVYKTCHAFVEMEGDRVIGLLVLEIDKKKDQYKIAIVQIDKRYQHRGYGKIMLEWAVNYLKDQGAKKLEIGVNRFNIPAQKLYLSIGFEVKSVYSEGLYLEMNL